MSEEDKLTIEQARQLVANTEKAMYLPLDHPFRAFVFPEKKAKRPTLLDRLFRKEPA